MSSTGPRQSEKLHSDEAVEETSSNKDNALSLPQLRNLILLTLVIGIALYTMAMFSLTEKLTARFGPQVRADLVWRVQRGAQELSRACELAVAVGDPTEIQGCFGVYAESKDVQAIIVRNAEGKVLAVHGQPPERFEQDMPAEEGSLGEGTGHLTSWAPVTIEGAPLGDIIMVVSTKRLQDATMLLERSSSMTIIGGLAALLLGGLVVTFFTRAVARRDAQLSDYAANLEHKVAERTQALNERNRGMRLVLDNVAQGFMTIDVHGVVASERSAIVDRWFGAPEPGVTLAHYLEPHCAEYGTWLEIGLEQIRDDLMPRELVLDQMPSRFVTNDHVYDVSYTAIGNDGPVDRLLVIISDVTEAVAHERAEREQRELVALFQRISVDRTGVEEFIAEAAGLVDALSREGDPVLQRRLVHTLKGNCAIYGLESYARLAHDIESELIETESALSDDQRTQLVTSWRSAMERVSQLLGASDRTVLEIQPAELDDAVARVRAGAPAGDVVALLESWTREPVERRFERLARQAEGVARRLGKPSPRIIIESNKIRLDNHAWSSVFSTMVHIVRNALDHGIEKPEVRVAAGKSEAGTLTFRAERRAGRLVLTMGDDGVGVDWAKLAAKAQASNLPHAKHADLVEALFADGLSTREVATSVSGRGVGLAALRQVVQDVGGSIDVKSVPGKGTSFMFVFEEQRVAARPNKRASRAAPPMYRPT